MPAYNMTEGGLSHRYMQSRAKIQVFAGAFANGKTAALCIKGIQVAGDYPGANLLLARETYPKLNDTLRKEFYKWIPPMLIRRRPTKDDNTLYMHNGTTVNFRYISQRGKTSEDGQTTSNLLSATYDFIGVDQVEDPGIIEKDFFDLIGRLRGSTPYRGSDPTMPPSGPRWLCLTCNPTSNWFYRRIIKPYHLYLHKGTITPELLVSPATGKPIIELFEGSTYENAANLSPDVLDTMEATYSGQMRDRYLLGKWAAYEGLVYPNFQEELHMLDKDFIMTYLNDLVVNRRIRIQALEGYDFGMTNPSCYILAFIDDFSRVFCIDGFYKSEFPLEDQAAMIMLIRSRYEHLLNFTSPISADPSLFRKKTMPGYKILGTTVAQRFMELGIRMRPADNSISAGIMKVSSYLNTYAHLPIISPPDKSSYLYFSNDLEFVRDEFGNYFWKRNPQGELEDEPIDRGDHAMDTIKYMLSFRPKPGEIKIPKSEVVPAWMFWHEVDEKRRAF
ncbi:MAG: terminase family protein [Nitrososphaera sp.]|nr:terminase family protein [Nitrososphaera sp.]